MCVCASLCFCESGLKLSTPRAGRSSPPGPEASERCPIPAKKHSLLHSHQHHMWGWRLGQVFGEKRTSSLWKVINTNEAGRLTCSVISPAQASSVFKTPWAQPTRRKRNLCCVFGTVQGRGRGHRPHRDNRKGRQKAPWAQPARRGALCPHPALLGQAVPLQGPCVCSQGLVYTLRN